MYQYHVYSFMAVIDGVSKFFEFPALDKDGALADLKAVYGAEAEIEIFLWKRID